MWTQEKIAPAIFNALGIEVPEDQKEQQGPRTEAQEMVDLMGKMTVSRGNNPQGWRAPALSQNGGK